MAELFVARSGRCLLVVPGWGYMEFDGFDAAFTVAEAVLPDYPALSLSISEWCW